MLRFLLLLLFPLLCTCDRAQAPVPLPELGSASAPARYADFSEISSLFQQQRDTTYLINFWATWCKPCREELPLLQRLAQEREGQALQVVLISLDTEEGAIARIPAFLQEAAPDLPAIVLTDEGQEWGKTIDRAWNGSLPTTIIYRGQLRYIYRRAFNSYPDLNTAMEPLLGKQ